MSVRERLQKKLIQKRSSVIAELRKLAHAGYENPIWSEEDFCEQVGCSHLLNNYALYEQQMNKKLVLLRSEQWEHFQWAPFFAAYHFCEIFRDQTTKVELQSDTYWITNGAWVYIFLYIPSKKHLRVVSFCLRGNICIWAGIPAFGMITKNLEASLQLLTTILNALRVQVTTRMLSEKVGFYMNPFQSEYPRPGMLISLAASSICTKMSTRFPTLNNHNPLNFMPVLENS